MESLPDQSRPKNARFRPFPVHESLMGRSNLCIPLFLPTLCGSGGQEWAFEDVSAFVGTFASRRLEVLTPESTLPSLVTASIQANPA